VHPVVGGTIWSRGERFDSNEGPDLGLHEAVTEGVLHRVVGYGVGNRDSPLQ
jgi:hypothetical protein